MDEVRLLADEFSLRFSPSGSSCDALVDTAKRQKCVSALILRALTAEVMKDALNNWPEISSWDIASFFTSGATYSRFHEMIFRDVAALPDYKLIALSILHHVVARESHCALGELTIAHLHNNGALDGSAGIDLVKLQNASHPITQSVVHQASRGAGSAPSSLCVVTVATSLRPQLRRLAASVSALNLPFQILGLDREWKGHGMKMVLLWEFLSNDQEYDTVLFVDAYDTLLLNPAVPNLLMKRFQSMGFGVVFNGERECSPDPSLGSVWPPELLSHPLPFLNSGVFVGSTAVLRAMLESVRKDAAENFGVFGEDILKMDDQRLYTRWFLNNRHLAAVDSTGFLFHTLHEFGLETFVPLLQSGALWSHATQTAPLVLHGNGNGCQVLFHLVDKLGEQQWPPAFTPPAGTDLHAENVPWGGGDDESFDTRDEHQSCVWPFNAF